jgi:hypothetical protein
VAERLPDLQLLEVLAGHRRPPPAATARRRWYIIPP